MVEHSFTDPEHQDSRESQTPGGDIAPDDAKELDLLAWRSMPSLDGQEEDFAFKVSRANRDGGMNVHNQSGLGDKNMPSSVSQIVERFSEIPIYKILSAKVIEGTGAPSFARAQRLT